MSFGLGRGRALDAAPGRIGVSPEELPGLPDDVREHSVRALIDPRAWFARPERPLEIEIGSGKGAFLLQQASQDPGTNYLGIEWAGEFYAYTADRVRRRGLENVRVLHGDATEFLRWRVPDAMVRVVHLYFSDPWPKARHHKRRVVQDRFLEDVHRVLLPAGELRIVTDHDDYWQWMEERFARWAPADGSGRFERLPFERPASAGDGEVVGTNFERKYAREGRPFHAIILRRK
jgi:tRNA (guanine-N7-)-methyltransferase